MTILQKIWNKLTKKDWYPSCEEMNAWLDVREEYERLMKEYCFENGKTDPFVWLPEEMARRGFPGSSIEKIRRGVKP
jgi:hypothetical protein